MKLINKIKCKLGWHEWVNIYSVPLGKEGYKPLINVKCNHCRKDKYKKILKKLQVYKIEKRALHIGDNSIH